MVIDTVRNLIELGIPHEQIHNEIFRGYR